MLDTPGYLRYGRSCCDLWEVCREAQHQTAPPVLGPHPLSSPGVAVEVAAEEAGARLFQLCGTRLGGVCRQGKVGGQRGKYLATRLLARDEPESRAHQATEMRFLPLGGCLKNT